MSCRLRHGRAGLGRWCEDDAQQDQGDPDREGEQGAGHDRIEAHGPGRGWTRMGRGCGVPVAHQGHW